MKPCNCDPYRPANTQTLCAECAAHRLGVCDGCGIDAWWKDLFQVQGSDGAVTELCAGCVEATK